MENIEIVYNQLDAAIAVMREVDQWGREKGFRVWLDEWLTPEELLTDEAKPESFCIGEIDGKIACAFILQRRDSAYWNDSSVVQAVYLHKLCVKREYAHRNMTKLVVEAIKDECRKKGIKYIRLDTGLDEKVVRKIYLNAGFKIVDIIDYDNRRSVALYEMVGWDDNLKNPVQAGFLVTDNVVTFVSYNFVKFGLKFGSMLGIDLPSETF